MVKAESNFPRLEANLKDAVERGAKVAFGGGAIPDELAIEPTILTGVPEDAKVMQDESFGPIRPVIDRVEDAIGRVRRAGKPLATHLFSSDDAIIENVPENTSSGAVSNNGWSAHYFEHELPFGGVGTSGMGVYHGAHGFRELSHARAVAALPTA